MKENPAVADPSLIENNGKNILSGTSLYNKEAIDYLLDEDWARQAFLISDVNLDDAADISNRYWSSASYKFTDTRIGGNIGINSRPQFTRYSDIRVKGRYGSRRNVSVNSGGNYGMGRYYSEAIDDPSQNIYLRFGVPQFNGIVSYLTRAFDPNLSSLAKTGRGSSFFYSIAKAAGTVAGIILFPSFALTVAVGRSLHFLFGRASSKYYTLKPTMPLYWSSVNVLVNTLAINRGIYPKIANPKSPTSRLGTPYILDQEYLDELTRLLPDVFRDSHYFDIYAMANRAQVIANGITEEDNKRLDNATATDYVGYLKKNLSGNGTHATYLSDSNGDRTLLAALDRMVQFSRHFTTDDPSGTISETDPRLNTEDPNLPKDKTFANEFFEYFDSELRDGSQFAIFKVDNTGSVSESFSNSVAESDLSNKLNGVSSDVRQAKFSFGDGQTGISIVDSAMGAVANVAKGLLDGATFNFSNFILGLAGTGYLDIPKYWQSSSASLPKSNYSIQLISPYGNPISQIQNIHIPLAMILAGALPLSTGKQSYTSPFICQLYDRGRCQIQLGMIESLSITRGTSHLPFDTRGNALAIDVNFTVVDLSSIMHMPISSGGITELDMTLDEDNILSDYLAVLAGQDLYSQMYAFPRAKLKMIKSAMVLDRVTSPAWLASAVHDTLPFMNVLEGITRGASVITNINPR